MHNYSEELQIAKKAARKAADIIRSFQQDYDFEINFKGKNDLVTDADVAAEKAIIETLKERFPSDQILAEESENGKLLSGRRTWIVDPIDGTTNFAHGFPVFCVSIGFWENREARAAVVFEINSEECFSTVKGTGAYLNGDAITVSSVEKLSYSLIGTGFPYNNLSLMKNYLRFFEWLIHHTQAIRRPGAASYDLCCVACGRFDGFYEYALNPWDVGAAGLIVQEAGGVVTDWEGGDNWLSGERIVAGNPAIHKKLLESIQEHFSEQEVGMTGDL